MQKKLRLFIFAAGLMALGQVISAQAENLVPTIHAVPEGGNWNNASTWAEDRVPVSTDVVEINGTVQLYTGSTVTGLVVTTGSTLENYPSRSSILTVNGDIINHGVIRDDDGTSSTLTVKNSNNVTNNGQWNNYRTHFFGTDARSIGGTNSIASDVKFDGSFAISNSLAFPGNVDFGGQTLTLNAGETMQVSGDISGVLYLDGATSLTVSGNVSSSTISLSDGDFILAGADQTIPDSLTVTANQIVFGGSGTKKISYQHSSYVVTLNGTVTVEEGVILQNETNSKLVTINGDIINHGLIRDFNTSARLTLKVSGNLTNDGEWNNYYTRFFGTDARSIGGTNPIESDSVDFDDSFAISNSPVFTGNVDFNGETLTLNAGQTMQVSGDISGTLYLDGATSLTVSGNVSSSTISLSDGDFILAGADQTIPDSLTVTANQIVFGGSGTKKISYQHSSYVVTLNGTVTVEEGVILQNETNSKLVTINGDIINHGLIRDFNTSARLTLKVSGNLTNDGEWNNYYTRFFGTDARSIGGTNPIESDSVDFDDSFAISNSPVFTGNVDFNGETLTLNAGQTMQVSGDISGTLYLDGATSLTVSGNVSSSTISLSDGDFILAGADQTIPDSLTVTANQIVFGGSGTKKISYQHSTYVVTLNGTVTVEEGVILQNETNSKLVTINGDIINHGVIRDFNTSATLTLKVSGNLTNNGVWTNYRTYVFWESISGIHHYEFSITGEEVVELYTTSYDISAYLNNAGADITRTWQIRGIMSDSTATEWSETKGIIVHYHIAIKARPNAYAFGGVNVGEQSQPQQFAMTNTGNLDLYIGSIYLTGSDAAEFTITSDNCSGQLFTPTQTCTVDVVFAPQTTSSKYANLVILSNAPTTLEVGLTGGAGLPEQTVLIAPSGTINTNLPTFSWYAVATATLYRLSVTDASSNTTQQEYTAQEASCPNGIGICSVTPTTPLPQGNTQWKVQTENNVGHGLWSAPLTFQVATPAGVLQFSSADYSVNEGNGTVTITVTRNGGSTGAVSVFYATTNGTATAGSDYTPAFNSLNWGDGDAAAKTFTVNIIEDSAIEDDETLYLSLGNITGGATLGIPSTATLTIRDNDNSSQIHNDILIDFGPSLGIQAYLNNSSWANVHSLSPESMITGDMDGSGQDEVIIDFGPDYGVWLWMNNSSWVKLHSLSPESMITGYLDSNNQEDVIIDFGSSYGIWLRMNNSNWVSLHTLSPESMVTGDLDGSGQDEVIINFGTNIGIWVRMNNSSWVQLHSLSSESIVTGDLDGSDQDEVIIDFGPDYGIWVQMNNSSWVQLHSLSPESMVTGDLDGNGQEEIIINFGEPYDFWIRMNNSSWVPFLNSVEHLVIGDLDDNRMGDVIISFGAQFGIWVKMNNSSWVQLHNLPAQQLVTGNIDGISSVNGISSVTMAETADMSSKLPAELENSLTELPFFEAAPVTESSSIEAQ